MNRPDSSEPNIADLDMEPHDRRQWRELWRNVCVISIIVFLACTFVPQVVDFPFFATIIRGLIALGALTALTTFFLALIGVVLTRKR